MPDTTPGPGTYSVDQKPDGPSFSILGKLCSPRSSNIEIPGPGAYNPLPRPTSPSFSIGTKTSVFTINEKVKDHLPGPGAYEIRSLKEGPYFSLGDRIANPLKIGAANPGPGTYDIPTTNEGPFFSLGDRITNSLSRPSTPGPGTYSVEPKPETPSYSFGSKLPNSPKPITQVPGPGQYDSRISPTLPSHSFGIKTPLMPKQDPNPGPGAYDCKLKSSGPQFSLLGRLPASNIDKQKKPGPGAYSTRDTTHYGPSYSLGGRIENRISNNFPGPGSYSITQRSGSPSFSLGGRINRALLKNETPGPGSYDLKEKSKGPSFSITGKPKNNMTTETNEITGPGAYESSIHTLGKDAPSYSLTSKSKEQKQTVISPGPGSYKVSKGRDGPAFSLSGKAKDQVIDARPGPGQYSPSLRCICLSSPAYRIGGRLEKNNYNGISNTVSPGPGAYSVKKDVEGPSFSILPKLKPGGLVNIRTPGPGSYDASLSYSSKSPKSPAYSLGTGLLPMIKQEHYSAPYKSGQRKGSSSPSRIPGKRVVSNSCTPGPRVYDSEQLPHGLAFSNGVSDRLNEKIKPVFNDNYDNDHDASAGQIDR
eukprot:Gb_19923 [translate_table: standard]